MSKSTDMQRIWLETDKEQRRRNALIRKELRRLKELDPSFSIPCPVCNEPCRFCIKCGIVSCVSKNCSYTGCHESTNLEKI